MEDAIEEKQKIDRADWGKKFVGELKDMLIGAAFPLMLMLILSATVVSFVAYSSDEDVALKIVILAVGEAMIIAANVIFGKQNGSAAYKKTLQNGNKRKVGSADTGAKLYIGEYSPVKGVIIPLISCFPFIVFQIINAAYANDVCKFALMYVFGWAYFPFKLAKLSEWLNLLMIIPFAGVHLGAYIFGADREKKKLEQLAAADEIKGGREGK